ncbi:glycosyltransferase [Flavobacterium sp.]|uniref:glycosyltransferase n=1 Tax=Flavobacterium sp. TaxID=239 RepID=UPI00261B96B4|nr:glycosyltransferase [Flavobacterium sp.]
MIQKRVLIIGMVWPEPGSSAAGSRMLQLVELFQDHHYEIIFSSAAQRGTFSFNFDLLGIRTQQLVLNDAGFDLFVSELNPEIVLFDRFITEEQFGWRVAENAPCALRILDTEDLHFLRQSRQLAVKQNRIFQDDDLFSDMARREIASMMRCDCSIIISAFEMDLLKRIFKIDTALLYYLPFLANPISPKDQGAWLPFHQRKGYMFIGNFYHEPNKDAVQFLKKNIWPRLRVKIPDAVIYIYGAYMPESIQQMHDAKNGFLIMGRASEALEAIGSARVMLAPLRFGAGIKGKLMEAMYCGTPSVTTEIGAEAMHLEGLWNGTFVDEVDDFVDAAVDLYDHQDVWEGAVQNGIKIFNERYNKASYGPEFVRHISFLVNNLPKHRQDNFLGSIFMHQTLSATKYMSRWIEAKNSNQ